jgi:RNA polymerase sigma factor (sigma-70 family)
VPTYDAANPIDAVIGELIRAKAWRIVKSASLHRQDHPDVEQELTARLLPKLSAYDPACGDRRTFAFTLLKHLGSNLLRDLRARKRDRRRARPLTDSDVARDARPGVRYEATQEQTDLALDVAEVLHALPADQRELVEWLKTESLVEIARRTNVSYTTLRYRVVRWLRTAFEKAGLKKYLNNLSSSREATGYLHG